MDIHNINNQLYKVLNTKRFEQGRTSSVKIVADTMTLGFILKLFNDGIIDASEYNLLESVYELDDITKITRANKSKIKNILISKIKPYVNKYTNEHTEEELDLNLPTVYDILDEIRNESKNNKLPIRITGTLPKSNTNKIEDKDKQLDKKDKPLDKKDETLENTESKPDKKDKPLEKEYSQKSIVTSEQRTLIRQLKNKMFTKDKIEIFPNQLLSSFINSDEDLSKYKVDLAICDKDTLELVCVVMILDKVELDFVTTLLYTLGIKRLVIKRNNNNILDAQDIRALEEEINNKYAPKCPKCGLNMMQKENIKTKHRFYACLDNQKCRFTIDMGD